MFDETQTIKFAKIRQKEIKEEIKKEKSSLKVRIENLKNKSADNIKALEQEMEKLTKGIEELSKKVK